MRDVGALTSDVKALQKSVEQLDQNDRKLQGIINQIRGGLIAAGIVGSLAIGLFMWLFSEKLDNMKDALLAPPAQTQSVPAQPKP